MSNDTSFISFSSIENSVDNFIGNKLPNIFSNEQTAILGISSACFIFVLMWKGFLIINGREEPKNAIWFIVKFGLIFSLINRIDYLQSVIEAFKHLKKHIANLFIENPLDNTYDYLFSYFYRYAMNVIASGSGWVDYAIHVIIGGIILGIGVWASFSVWVTGFLASTGFNILVLLTPLAVFSTLFSLTTPMFESWLKGVISSILVSLILALTIAFFVYLLEDLLNINSSSVAKGSDSLSTSSALLGACAFFILSFLLVSFKKVAMQIAEALSNVRVDGTETSRARSQGLKSTAHSVGKSAGSVAGIVSKAGSSAKNIGTNALNRFRGV